METRNSSIDLIKIISCIGVLLIHTVPCTNIFDTSLYYICAACVPIFFMTSGYFIMNDNKHKYSYYVKKARSIIKIVFIWSCVMSALVFIKIFAQTNDLNVSLKMLLHSFNPINICFCAINGMNKTYMFWQLWFLGALIILYLISPLLKKSFNNKNDTIFIMSFVLSIIIGISNILFNFIPSAGYNVLQLWKWVFYFMLGGYLKKYESFIKEKIKIKYQVIIVLVSGALLVLEQFTCNRVFNLSINVVNYYGSVFVMCFSFFLFMVISQIKISERIKPFILNFSKITFFIYISHTVIMDIFGYGYVMGNETQTNFLPFFVILIITSVLGWLFSKTPAFKRLTYI